MWFLKYPFSYCIFVICELQYNEQDITWPQLLTLVESNCGDGSQLLKLPKVTHEHLYLSPSHRMKVRLAVQVCNKFTSSGKFLICIFIVGFWILLSGANDWPWETHLNTVILIVILHLWIAKVNTVKPPGNTWESHFIKLFSVWTNASFLCFPAGPKQHCSISIHGCKCSRDPVNYNFHQELWQVLWLP